MIVEDKEGYLDQFTLKAIQKITTVDKHENNFVLTFSTYINSIINTIIFLHHSIYGGFYSGLFDENEHTFSYLFRIFSLCMDNIEHTDFLLNEKY